LDTYIRGVDDEDAAKRERFDTEEPTQVRTRTDLRALHYVGRFV
jgi:hypothetical protein